MHFLPQQHGYTWQSSACISFHLKSNRGTRTVLDPYLCKRQLMVCFLSMCSPRHASVCSSWPVWQQAKHTHRSGQDGDRTPIWILSTPTTSNPYQEGGTLGQAFPNSRTPKHAPLPPPTLLACMHDMPNLVLQLFRTLVSLG
jgi:hypothetical protein